MAGSVNKVILIGNLGRDPEIRSTQSGARLANLTVATSENWKDRNTGERREKTEWHRVVVFNEGLVKVIENYVHKGSKVYIEGQLETRKWEDQNGQERYTTEVVLKNFNGTLTMLDSRGSSGDNMGGGFGGGAQNDSGFGAPAQAAPAPQAQAASPAPAMDEFEDEIPF